MFKDYFKDFLALLSGLLLVFAFAPCNYTLFAFISLLLLLYTWHGSTKKRAFWRGFLFGIGNYGFGIHWLYISIVGYGGDHTIIAFSLTALLTCILSLFIGMIGTLQRQFFKKNPNIQYICLFPLLWTSQELLRSYLFTGFPWLLLGYTQTSGALSGFAPLGSVYLLTFIITLISGLLFSFYLKHNLKNLFLTIIGLTSLLLLGTLLKGTQWTHLQQSKAVKATIVQGDFPEMLKWDPAYLDRIIDTYYQLTEKNISPLVFWPENAIPLFTDQDPLFFHALSEWTTKNNIALLTGKPHLNLKKNQYYNSAQVFGKGHGRYFKHHLVPFAEYFPFESIIRPFLNFMNVPMSSFSKGAYHQHLLKMQKYHVAVNICYESAFPLQIRDNAENANFLVILSDDSWFGRSIGPWQHLQIGQMRALENGKYLIQSTNSGITAIINAQGEIVKSAPPFQRTTLQGKIKIYHGKTPWARYGILPLMMLMLFMLALAICLQHISTTQEQKQRS